MILGVFLLTTYQNCSDVHFSDIIGDLGGPTDPINPLACHLGSPEGVFTYPSPCLRKPSFLNSSSVGFQLSNAQLSKFTITSNDPVNGTSADQFLYLEVSTYHHPDSFKISYKTKAGSEHPLFSVCHVSTWTHAVLPQFGNKRPFSNTIVQFGKFGNDPQNWIKIPKGTVSITFDFAEIPSASYLAMWNLNDFKNSLLPLQNKTVWEATSQPAPGAAMPGSSDACPPLNAYSTSGYNCFSPGHFRYQTGALTKYNDDVDPTVDPDDWTTWQSDPNQQVCAD